MSESIVIVTFNRLNLSFLEVRNIVGKEFDVCDGVAGLERGQEMKSDLVYYFYGIGSAVVRTSEEKRHTLFERLDQESNFNYAWDKKEEYHQQDVLSATFEAFLPDSDSSQYESLYRDDPERKPFPASDLGKYKDWGWNHDAIRSRRMISNDCRGFGVKIAIMDTGIAKHKDLQPRGGVSFATGDDQVACDPFYDNIGHGTKCAGIAASKEVGVARDAELYSVKVSHAGETPAYAILAGLCWCLRNSMDIVSISLAGPSIRKFLHPFSNAVQALMANNCVVVAGAGDSQVSISYPANTPGVIAVGKYSKARTFINDTKMGGQANQITICAPSEEITTTYYKDNQYILFGGSSAATPHIAGAIALYKGQMMGISALQIISRLMTTARPLNNDATKQGMAPGAGLVDCDAMLTPRIGSVINKRKQKMIPQTRDSKLRQDDATHPTAILTVSLRNATGDGLSEYYYVAIANCTVKFAMMKRIPFDQPAEFGPVPLGRYAITILQEGEDTTELSEMLELTEEDAGKEVKWEIPVDMANPIGKITVVLQIGGPQPYPARRVDVQGITDTNFHKYKYSDSEGQAEFNEGDGILDNDQYKVTAAGFSGTKTCSGYYETVTFP